MADFIVNTAADTTDADPGVTSLREAILEANTTPEADTITFALTNDPPLIRLGSEIEITGELVIDGGGVVVITGDTNGDDSLVEGSDITDMTATDAANLTDNSRIFNVTSETAPLTLKGLTLTGGYTVDGGEDGAGGAVRSLGALTLDDMRVSGNTTKAQAAHGGGVYAAGALVVTNSTISGNTAIYANGGGLHGNSTTTVRNSTISDNTSHEIYGGGGISSDGDLYVAGSTINGNVSGSGGGIYGDTGLLVVNSTVVGNRADSYGGGIAGNSSIELIHSTVTGNTANYGGGLGVSGSGSSYFINLTNSIVLGNSAIVSGDEVEGPGGDRVNSIFEDQDPAEVFAQVIEFFPGNRPSVFAGVLADNGGPTQTIQIKADGPAHNVAGGTTSLDNDQRGGPRVAGGTVDIGAVELNRGLTAMDDSAATDSDDVATGLLLTNDNDDDDDTLTVGAVNGQEAAVGNEIELPSGALLLVNAAGEFTYNPNGAFDDAPLGTTETDSFEYTATDTEFEDIATVTLTIAGQAEQSSTGGGDEGGGNGETDGDGGGTTTGTNGPDLITCHPGNDNLNGLKGRDTICGGPGDDIVLGGSGRDRLTGAAGDDLMRGAKGNDLMSGGKGNDTLLGGEGHDKTFGLAGEDELRGGSGNDTVKGGGSNDELRGGLDHDLLMGGHGGDELYGGAGNDILHGGAGSDVIRGGRGNDRLIGDAGDDNFHFEQGMDHVHGGTGKDALIMEGDLEDYEISFGNGEVRIQRGDDMTTAVNIESLYFDDAVHLVDDLRALF